MTQHRYPLPWHMAESYKGYTVTDSRYEAFTGNLTIPRKENPFYFHFSPSLLLSRAWWRGAAVTSPQPVRPATRRSIHDVITPRRMFTFFHALRLVLWPVTAAAGHTSQRYLSSHTGRTPSQELFNWSDFLMDDVFSSTCSHFYAFLMTSNMWVWPSLSFYE